jgi:hypothetical protein
MEIGRNCCLKCRDRGAVERGKEKKKRKKKRKKEIEVEGR